MAGHLADAHHVIRVHGERENNLENVSVELPKRRPTVVTGVSGSGKISLVFATIAAESQPMINETYSAFPQVFMPILHRPDVDVLEGLTTAIAGDRSPISTSPRWWTAPGRSPRVRSRFPGIRWTGGTAGSTPVPGSSTWTNP